MSSYLLNSSSTIQCSHGAQAQATASESRVRVDGQDVVTQSSSHSISGCSNYVGTTTFPCVTAQWTSAATRVRAGGKPVLLQDSQATCVPTGSSLSIVMTQFRVKGT